jgi:hypothetical protein
MDGNKISNNCSGKGGQGSGVNDHGSVGFSGGFKGTTSGGTGGSGGTGTGGGTGGSGGSSGGGSSGGGGGMSAPEIDPASAASGLTLLLGSLLVLRGRLRPQPSRNSLA